MRTETSCGLPARGAKKPGPPGPGSSCRQSVDSLNSKNGNFQKSSHFCKDCNAKGDYHLRPPFVSFADISPAGGIFLSRSPHARPSKLRWVCLQSEPGPPGPGSSRRTVEGSNGPVDKHQRPAVRGALMRLYYPSIRIVLRSGSATGFSFGKSSVRTPSSNFALMSSSLTFSPM